MAPSQYRLRSKKNDKYSRPYYTKHRVKGCRISVDPRHFFFGEREVCVSFYTFWPVLFGAVCITSLTVKKLALHFPQLEFPHARSHFHNLNHMTNTSSQKPSQVWRTYLRSTSRTPHTTCIRETLVRQLSSRRPRSAHHTARHHSLKPLEATSHTPRRLSPRSLRPALQPLQL